MVSVTRQVIASEAVKNMNNVKGEGITWRLLLDQVTEGTVEAESNIFGLNTTPTKLTHP